MAKKRFFKKKDPSLKGSGYDSLLEKHVHQNVLPNSRFHDKGDKVSYVVTHTYEPDFVVEKDGSLFYVETKGRFRDSTEARKYLFIRDSLPPNAELVFVWGDSGTVFPFAKKRKDGTKATHEEWANKNGFRNWVLTNFKEELL